ncbi:MAG: Mut7-C RNAse domain-containing protein [Dissulfurispiraceae bacterium]
MGEQPRFIVDVMLGSLAKWLRLFSFDTLYFRKIDDNELIKIARYEQRLLITRDSTLASTKKTRDCILITSETLPDQLKEVLAALRNRGQLVFESFSTVGDTAVTDKPEVPGRVGEMTAMSYYRQQLTSVSRCVRCNGLLMQIDKASISGEIPEHVFLKHTFFLKCTNCSKIYWEGSHSIKMAAMIKEVLTQLG